MKNLPENVLAHLTQVLETNQQVMSKLLNRLEKQDSPWVDPDDAARMLGISISKSGNHRRKLAYLAKKGFIPRYREGRPYYYWRDDLLQLQPKIASGDVVIPSRIYSKKS